MTIKEISNYIKTLNPNIDSKTLEYLTNYFYVALKRKVIPIIVSLVICVILILLCFSLYYLYHK